ncbi:HIT family protein [Sediminivirga luteola]|uniref:HIT family protein n=1 Tax=Sediminivirga luteola TaxID=1774748 RepID=A0A8J2TWV6_9MICO|nr:HIT family protein [Sediminivirga luteola]GGA09090.1 HIT family protein [Sediminivirga luteola]
MATLFTKIIGGEIPARFIHQDETAVAFLDVTPITDGHALVLPRREVSHWLDLTQDELHHLMDLAQRIGQAQKASFDCDRIGLLIQGYEVPHVHIHVWPTKSTEDFRMDRRRGNADPAALDEAAQTLRTALG